MLMHATFAKNFVELRRSVRPWWSANRLHLCKYHHQANGKALLANVNVCKLTFHQGVPHLHQPVAWWQVFLALRVQLLRSQHV